MERTPWELPEVFASSTLASVVVLLVGGIVSGITEAALQSDNLSPGNSTSQIIAQATGWADVLAAFLTLAGVLIIWQQANSWANAIDSGEDDHNDAAAGHLMRARLLAVWAGRLTGVVALAAIVWFVAYTFALGNGPGPAAWPIRISAFAALLATLVLCTAGILGTMVTYRLCGEELPLTAPNQGGD
jgi:hypothetical protein